MLFRQKPVPHETPEQVAERMRRGDVVLIDVREPAEYAHERIEGAILYPLSRFDAHGLPHPAGKQIVFVSEHSKRSAQAWAKAEKAGMHPHSQLEGGIEAWKAAGLPTIHGSAMQI